MPKNSESQQAPEDAPEPSVDGSIPHTRTVSRREYQSKQFLNPPLKTAAGDTAGNSGPMLIQTGMGSNGGSGSLTLTTGASASCCDAGDMTAIVGPTDSATGGGGFTLTSGSAYTGAGSNVVVTAGVSGGYDGGLSVVAAGSSTVSEREY